MAAAREPVGHFAGILAGPGGFRIKIKPADENAHHSALEATARVQSPDPIRFPNHSAGNSKNLAKTIRNTVKNGFLNCRVFLPFFAKQYAMKD